jgi:TPR repeat protein
MKITLFLLLFLYSLNGFSNSIILKPGKNEAQKELVDQWKLQCEQKISNGCYNLGVYHAQTLQDEKKALTFYQKSCQANLAIACFNQAGIQIKSKKTLDQGVKSFQKACDLSKDPKLDTGERSSVAKGCQFAVLIPKYRKLEYRPMVVKVLEEIEREDIPLKRP